MTAIATTTNPEKKALSPEAQQVRERNAMVATIKGQMWSKDLSAQQVNALAHYCNTNGLDASRHVEVLGGRIYLTADFYRERGAPLIQRGIVRVGQTRFINNDARLTKLAETGDEWAKQEIVSRARARIEHNVPEDAKAIAIVELYVAGNPAPLLGVNWCGGTSKRDPVGDAEPTKTAESRAERRAWRRVVEVVPEYGVAVTKVEATAKMVGEEIGAIAEAMPSLHNGASNQPKALRAPDGETGYGAEVEGTAEATDA
jgi:hypothetical protein